MNINLPSKVRKAIYIVSTVVSPVMVFLADNNTISKFQLGLYVVIMTGVTALAAINTDTSV